MQSVEFPRLIIAQPTPDWSSTASSPSIYWRYDRRRCDRACPTPVQRARPRRRGAKHEDLAVSGGSVSKTVTQLTSYRRPPIAQRQRSKGYTMRVVLPSSSQVPPEYCARISPELRLPPRGDELTDAAQR